MVASPEQLVATHTKKQTNSLKGNSLSITVIAHVRIEKIHTTCCKTSINYSKKIPQTEPTKLCPPGLFSWKDLD